MDLNIAQDRFDLVKELTEHLVSVEDAIAKKDVFDFDLEQLQRIKEKLLSLNLFIVAESKFKVALDEMEEMKTSDEDSKWTFPLEKAFSSFMKEDFLLYIGILVNVSRSWDFNDYRARDFQSKLRQKMEMLRNWYKERYDL